MWMWLRLRLVVGERALQCLVVTVRRLHKLCLVDEVARLALGRCAATSMSAMLQVSVLASVRAVLEGLPMSYLKRQG
jgi:hypothetical protein